MESPFPEVQLNAIQTLGAAGDAVHAQFLHKFLLSNNPVLVETTVEALGQIGDRSAARPIARHVQQSNLSIMSNWDSENAHETRSRGLRFSSRTELVKDGNANQYERKVALEILGEMPGWEALDGFLEFDVDALNVGLRLGSPKPS